MSKKIKKWWDKNKGVVCFIGGSIAWLSAAIFVNEYVKKLQKETQDEFVPIKLFDKDGKVYRFFKWDTGYNNDPIDMIFYPAEQIDKDVDWDSL